MNLLSNKIVRLLLSWQYLTQTSDNVCTTREVLEEGEEDAGNLNIDVSGGGSFHLQVNQCTEKSDSYECVKTVAEQVWPV